jgi:hypothetical protein
MSRLSKYTKDITEEDTNSAAEKTIISNPTEVIISGNVVDVNDLNDFVNTTSPHLLRTIVDREVNKVQSQAAQYVFSMKGKRKPFPIALVLIALAVVIIIAVALMIIGSNDFDIGAMFKGLF